MTPALISILINAAVRSLIFAGAAGLALKLLRVRDVGAKLAAWTAVLYGVLLMPLAGTLAPPLGVPLGPTISRPAVAILAASPSVQKPPRAAQVPTPGQPLPRLDWRMAATALYIVIAGVLFGRLMFGLMLTRRLRRACRPVDDPRPRTTLLEQTGLQGVRRVPLLMESDALAVPITLGWRRSSIVLPVSWREWDDAKLGAVLAHELSHVRRGDHATLLLAAMNRCLFWFSPLSWWLDRHLRELAEQASDDSALRVTADRTSYAEVLLGFFETLHDGRGRVRWQGVAMARSGRADRRIDRILAANRTLSAPAKWPVMLGLAVLTIPLLYLSAAVQPRERAASDAALLAPTSPVRLLAQATQPPAPVPPRRGTTRSHDSYVIMSGDDAPGFRFKIADDYIWFRRDSDVYIIRDPATVKAALKFFEPQQDLGRQQGELGALQGKLGELQGKLGERQSGIRRALPDLSKEIEKLKQSMRHAGTSEEIGEVQALLGDMQAKISEQQAKIGEQQAKIGEEQAKLGEEQAKLGERQAALGEQQARLAEEATRQLKVLIDEAFRKGLAEPEPR